MPAVFEVYKDAKGEHRFRLKAPNGQIIASGESYATKAACLNGIESIRTNVALPERLERYQDKQGEHRFRLKAANNQIIAIGEGYSSESGLTNGIESMKRYATSAKIKLIE